MGDGGLHLERSYFPSGTIVRASPDKNESNRQASDRRLIILIIMMKTFMKPDCVLTGTKARGLNRQRLSSPPLGEWLGPDGGCDAQGDRWLALDLLGLEPTAARQQVAGQETIRQGMTHGDATDGCQHHILFKISFTHSTS